MNQHPPEENDWQSVRRTLLDAVGEPTDEDLRAVRESVKRQIAGQQKSERRWWIWNTAAAVACAAAVLAVVDLHVGVRESKPQLAVSSLSAPVIAPREFVQVALVKSPAHLRRVRLSTGIRSVAWDTQRDELKLTTADPNVVILLPMNKESDENEN